MGNSKSPYDAGVGKLTKAEALTASLKAVQEAFRGVLHAMTLMEERIRRLENITVCKPDGSTDKMGNVAKANGN